MVYDMVCHSVLYPVCVDLTLQASLSGTLPSNLVVIGYAIEGALLIFTHLATRIAPAGLMLSAPSVTFANGLGTKVVETRKQSHSPQVKVYLILILMILISFVLA